MNKYFCPTLFVILTLLFAACVSEMDAPAGVEGGTLRLSFSNISTATTRTTPGELGKPSPTDFRLTIAHESGHVLYDDVFTEDELTLPVGKHDVRVTYGRDALLALDAPFYMGQTEVEIEKDKTAEASLKAQVANALVSVRFGEDDEEHARFDRFYTDYALRVYVDNFHIGISKDETEKSVYVRAGSHVTLRFWGKLRFEDEREVICELTSEDFPDVLNAADHAIVTLTLPDPESALGPDITKVEVETVTLDETIPLSWLPVAMVIPMHQYDKDGCLVGTNLIITESYPGKKWRAVITDAAGTTVRAVEGTGTLQSEYNAEANKNTWPYLPHGQYKASYYFVEDDGTTSFVSSRDFTVDAPTELKVSVTGYTSYTKYLEGDIAAANACERLTVYEPSVALNVATSLLRNSHYTYTFTYTYDGAQYPVNAGDNSYGLETLPNQPVRSTVYVLRGDATFDGVSVSAQTDFRITGLPYSLNLASHGEWEEYDDVYWYDNDVRLGGPVSTGSQSIQTISSVCIPPSTYFCADYSVNVHTATVGTTYTMKVGDVEILNIGESGKVGNVTGTDHVHTGTTPAYTDGVNYANQILCRNSYGAGQTCTHIYSFTLKYAKP